LTTMLVCTGIPGGWELLQCTLWKTWKSTLLFW